MLTSLILTSGLCAAAQTPSTTPELEYVMQLRVTCDPAVPVGATTTGSRLTIPISGGTFTGPRLRGEVLKGGADFQLHHADTGRTDLEALYNIRTDDGVTIHVRNGGIIAPDGKGYYFYTRPVFEAPVDSHYAWLNDAVFVCRPDDKGMPGGVVLNVWRVCDPYDFDATIRQPDTVPHKVYAPAVRRGKVETFHYNTVGRDGKPLKKRAQVYTPYNYKKGDKSTRYNVLYLMHGGGDNSTSFFADPRSPLPLTNVLDHLIADGKLEPLIVVAPTFYPDDENIGTNGMGDAIAMTRYFHRELRRDLIPAVETAYNTYLQGADSAAVTASRGHRAFGGFSMGALATWYQLAYDNEAVRHYLPLSGDLWTYEPDGTRQPCETSARWLEDRLKGTPFADDFYVYAYTGTDDIAGEPEKNLIRALDSQTSLFRYRGKRPNVEF
ncbi:MAG: DUF3237 family protein [Duncaniella sp.]|nr:DUF3237 family protein [Duncaniella sp.]